METFKVTRGFGAVPAFLVKDLHLVPARQSVASLDGANEIETSPDGKRIFEPV